MGKLDNFNGQGVNARALANTLDITQILENPLLTVRTAFEISKSSGKLSWDPTRGYNEVNIKSQMINQNRKPCS